MTFLILSKLNITSLKPYFYHSLLLNCSYSSWSISLTHLRLILVQLSSSLFVFKIGSHPPVFISNDLLQIFIKFTSRFPLFALFPLKVRKNWLINELQSLQSEWVSECGFVLSGVLSEQTIIGEYYSSLMTFCGNRPNTISAAASRVMLQCGISKLRNTC